MPAKSYFPLALNMTFAYEAVNTTDQTCKPAAVRGGLGLENRLTLIRPKGTYFTMRAKTRLQL